jgi:hypothetical protein
MILAKFIHFKVELHAFLALESERGQLHTSSVFRPGKEEAPILVE